MTSLDGLTPADFDFSKATLREQRRREAGEVPLIPTMTPTRKPRREAQPEQLPGQGGLFGDDATEPPSVPAGAMCRCSAPATGPVICSDGQDRYLCDDCRAAEIRACHERDTAADRLGWPICRKCGQTLRWRPEIHRDVTTTSNNPECYGRRS